MNVMHFSHKHLEISATWGFAQTWFVDIRDVNANEVVNLEMNAYEFSCFMYVVTFAPCNVQCNQDVAVMKAMHDLAISVVDYMFMIVPDQFKVH